ncbi:beta-ketoacyl-ACP synthase III [Calderihabitans maritimus]|uniref:Beta-ketoacyl-[acyl-carrier-protein] synthase III n=1 Tax=Calderihabitans maritimus TaxID=1246530 RepID=A0A1Z5HNH2_9FIRM|nr:beta-ketoacyl-ACP synthase III [Calderihabitans maritimus]GAW91076.1 3-oxoacyl-ACP synthase [Calderihabitans maritimus]
MLKNLRPVGIVGTGSYVPEQIISNSDLEKMVDTSDEWIRTRTGIRERRKADDNTATSDLAIVAAQRALEDAGVNPEDVDLIIVATVTPDMLFPATACLVQKAIGAERAAAFDLEAACSGFIYGLGIGSQMVATGLYDTVLVIAADTLSKIVDWTDRNTCVLFGDGAGAAVLRPVSEGEGILGNYLKADGNGSELLKVPAGGSRLPSSVETVTQRLHYIHMNGNEVFKFAVRIMEEAALKALEQCGLSKKDIDYLIPHQANIRIVEAALKRLEVPSDKVYINLDRYGNISGASIAVALDEALKEGKIQAGDLVLLVGFGAGLTWGATVIRWPKGLKGRNLNAENGTL